MYDDLELLLSTKVAPERIALLLDAAAVLDELGMDGHQMELELLVHRHDSMDPLSYADEVDAALRAGLLTAIESHGIRADEAASLHWYTAILRGLTLLPEYEDTAAIEAVCEAVNDPEAALADLLGLVSEYSSEDFIVLLDSVSPRLIERLMQLLRERAELGLDDGDELVDEECEDIVGIETIRTRLLRYLGNDTFIVAEAIRQGLPLGLPPQALLTRFDPELEVLNPQRVVEEVVAILLASCAKTEAVHGLAGEYLENLFGDPRQVANSAIQLTNILREYVNHEQA